MTHDLTQVELKSLKETSDLIRHYQILLDSLRLSFRTKMLLGPITRMSIDESSLDKAVIDFDNGLLVIPEEQKPTKETKTKK